MDGQTASLESLRVENAALRARVAEFEASRTPEETTAAVRLRAVCEVFPDLLFILDEDGRYLEVLTAAHALLYAEAETLRGQLIVDVMDEEPAELFCRVVRETAESGQSQHVEYELDVLAGRRWFEGRTARVAEIVDDKRVVLFIARDVTDRKLAELELARSNAELEQFAYIASHDLKEPLRTLESSMKLLAGYSKELAPEARGLVDYAQQAAQRSSALIDALLAYSRAGTTELSLAPTDCNAVLRRVLRNLAPAIGESRARIEVAALPDDLCVDELQVEQLLQNLLANAIKFHADESPRVRVSCQQESDAAHLVVEDEGIGVAFGDHELIFEAFRRLHGVDKYGGTGIGLALCRKIVERHGGRIWVESELGSGAAFHVTLPRPR